LENAGRKKKRIGEEPHRQRAMFSARGDEKEAGGRILPMTSVKRRRGSTGMKKSRGPRKSRDAAKEYRKKETARGA